MLYLYEQYIDIRILLVKQIATFIAVGVELVTTIKNTT